MLSYRPQLQRIWTTVGQEDWSLGGLNTNELWHFCFWNSKSFSRPQSTYREVPCGSKSCALLHLAGLSRTPQLQAIFTNHPRNKVCGHACVTFIHPHAQIAGALRQTWDKPSAIKHTEADYSPESRMNVNVILRAIISLIARHYVVKTEYFASALVQVLLF